MISWSRAFWKGFMIFLWGILWAVVGMLIFFLLSASIFASMVSMIKNPQDIINNPQIITQITENFIGPLILILVIVGIFVGIATYASIVKVVTDTVMEEVRRIPPIQPIPIPPPPPSPQIQPPPQNEDKK